MKKLVFAVLLFAVIPLAWADHNPAEYTTTVHVVASRLVNHQAYYHELSTVIDGKKVELQATSPCYGLLKQGDYKAKLLNEGHKSEYESWQVYEFLFPDGKTRRYVVMEETP